MVVGPVDALLVIAEVVVDSTRAPRLGTVGYDQGAVEDPGPRPL